MVVVVVISWISQWLGLALGSEVALIAFVSGCLASAAGAAVLVAFRRGDDRKLAFAVLGAVAGVVGLAGLALSVLTLVAIVAVGSFG